MFYLSSINGLRQRNLEECIMIDQSLLVFVTVAEKKSFTRAAEALHMTQPAVSQYIQTLEKNVGAKLLDRSNKMFN